MPQKQGVAPRLWCGKQQRSRHVNPDVEPARFSLRTFRPMRVRVPSRPTYKDESTLPRRLLRGSVVSGFLI